MTDRRPLLRTIFDAAVAAAHPDVVLAQHLRAAPKGRVICLAAGKGAAAMAAAAERHYLDALGLDPAKLVGIATTRHGHGVPTRRIRVVEAGHPVPDEAGLRAADDTLRLAAEATADDLLLVLISGGGSANWIAPVDGVTFAQKQQVNRALLRSGAPIGEMNIVRKHLSRIKGGRLARAGQHAAEIVTLAISDVPHDDPSAIASGRRCLIQPRSRMPAPSLPNTILRSMTRSGARSTVPQMRAASRATPPLPRAVRTDRQAQGVARRRGSDRAGCRLRDHRARRRSRRRSPRNCRRPRAAGAESAQRGQAHRHPVRRRTHGHRARQWPWRPEPGICAIAGKPAEGHIRHFGAGGGYRRRRWRRRQRLRPAGAIIDQSTFVKMRSLGLDPKAYLENNDATAFFAATGDLLLTGPTLTNVNDVRVILVDGA